MYLLDARFKPILPNSRIHNLAVLVEDRTTGLAFALQAPALPKNPRTTPARTVGEAGYATTRMLGFLAELLMGKVSTIERRLALA